MVKLNLPTFNFELSRTRAEFLFLISYENVCRINARRMGTSALYKLPNQSTELSKSAD